MPLQNSARPRQLARFCKAPADFATLAAQLKPRLFQTRYLVWGSPGRAGSHIKGGVMDPLILAAMSGSTVKIVQQALKQWLTSGRKQQTQTDATQTDGRGYQIDLNQASPELLNKIQDLLATQKPATPNILELSRTAANTRSAGPAAAS